MVTIHSFCNKNWKPSEPDQDFRPDYSVSIFTGGSGADPVLRSQSDAAQSESKIFTFE